MIRNITIIGSGNVATHLAKAYSKKGLKIECIFSRKIKNARALATVVRSDFTDDLNKVPTNSDFYLLCVPDGVIKTIAQKLKKRIDPKSIVCHTSGTTDGSSLSEYFKHGGVFYPLQTFSKHRKVKLSEVPLFISPQSKRGKKAMQEIGKRIFNNCEVISDSQRQVLHIAAVFANNFSNYLFQVADEILRKKDLQFNAVRPLIKETAAKIQKHNPHDMQTGPALRNDQLTLDKHLAYLEQNHPDHKDLYRILTNGIQKQKL